MSNLFSTILVNLKLLMLCDTTHKHPLCTAAYTVSNKDLSGNRDLLMTSSACVIISIKVHTLQHTLRESERSCDNDVTVTHDKFYDEK